MKRTLNLFKVGALSMGLLFALYSCNDTDDSSTTTDTETITGDGTADNQEAAVKYSDPQIASIAVTANQVDIDYAHVAIKNASNPEVKAFAETMAKDHQGVIDAAVALAGSLNLTPDDDNEVTKSLLEGEKEMLSSFEGKSGAEFDKAYIDNEVEYHKAAIDVVEKTLIPQAENAELKALLESALPNFKEHLKHAEAIQASLK